MRRDKPAVVFFEGDERALGLLDEQVSPDVRERAVRLDTGGRAKGVSRGAEADAIEEVLDQRRGARAARLCEDFEAARGVGGRAVDGLAAVVEALRKAQVATLLLHDDPAWDTRLYVGDGAGGAGLSLVEVRQDGVADPRTDRADAALVWALAATGGSAGLVGKELDLRDGVGAILRWDDDSTRH